MNPIKNDDDLNKFIYLEIPILNSIFLKITKLHKNKIANIKIK
jgi:hypothetical protein